MLDRAVGEVRSRPIGDVVRLGRHASFLAVATLSGAVAMAVWFLAQLAVLGPVLPETIATNLDGRSEALRPGDPIQVMLTAERAELQGVHLFRSEQTEAGERREVPVAVRAEPLADATWRVLPAHGATLLRPDGSYRLVVQASVPRAALPFPRPELVERQYRFDTVASPRLVVPTDTLRPRWAEPVALRWSTSVQSVDVSVHPAAPIRVWVDEQDAKRTWLQLGGESGAGLLAGQTYEVTFVSAVTPDGIPLERPATIRIATADPPRLLAPSRDLLRPRWAEPTAVSWTLPLQSTDIRVEPAVPAAVWVDPVDATRTWVRLGGEGGAGLVADQTYEVTFLSAVTPDGIPLQQPATLRVAVPARPRILNAPAEPATLRLGESMEVSSSLPLTAIEWASSGDLTPVVTLEQQRIRIAVPDYRQGAEVTLTISDARSDLGAPLLQPVTFTVKTPPALALTTRPEDGSGGVAVTSKPSITFAGPVADRAAAERAISLEPAVDGTWEWVQPDRLAFAPAGRLPSVTDFTITVRGGPDGPRSAAGGYLEQDMVAEFRTTHYKKIEIDISEQRLYMLEHGEVIRTIIVGTGVPGAETPVGDFEVLYKMDKVRFRGTNPSGRTYDIPNVRYILPFWGDYSIHGAYWRSSFGTPGSNGCVGMPDAEAKIVYEWADTGTPVSIRQ